MKTYIGTKIIDARPMNRSEYNEYRGWELPANENGADEGYLVEYYDGGKANDSRHAGYISWSPKEQFEGAYRETSGLSFGLALEALKKGAKVDRAGWNGKGMWLQLVKGRNVKIHGMGFGPTNEHDHDWRDRVPELLSWIGMKTADNKFVPWLASQTDMLAEDWSIVQ
jgi:hypothetical protein